MQRLRAAVGEDVAAEQLGLTQEVVLLPKVFVPHLEHQGVHGLEAFDDTLVVPLRVQVVVDDFRLELGVGLALSDSQGP
eukprot:UN4662